MPARETDIGTNKESISKYISFDGTDEKWKVFRSQAEALGVKKGWWDSLQSKASPSDDDTKKEKRASAKFFLTMACLGGAGAYVKSKDPWTSWNALLKRYEEVDVSDLSTLHKLLNQIVNEGPGNDDPEVWFLKIDEAQEDITKAGGNPKGDSDLLSQIQDVIAKSQYKEKGELIKTVKNVPNIGHYRDEMFKYWKANIKPLFLKKDPADVAFLTQVTNSNGTFSKNGYKFFKMNCHNCGKPGHKKIHCPDLKGNAMEVRKETRICHYCGKSGHLKAACRKRILEMGAKKKDGGATGVPQAAFIGFTGGISHMVCKIKPKPVPPRRPGFKSWGSICDDDSDDDGDGWESVMTLDAVLSTSDAVVNPNLWLMDSGATVNVTNDEDTLRDPVEIQREIVVGNGQQVTATKQGWVVLKVNKTDKMILKEVLFVAGFVKKIISVSKLCNNGITMRWEGDGMFLTSPEGKELRLPRRRNGMCYVLDHKENNETAHDPMILLVDPVMDIQEAHDLLGHASEAITRKTMEHMGVTLTGQLLPCEGCLLEKAQRKAIPKLSLKQATMPCERLLLDTTGPFAPSLRGAIYDVYVACQLTSKSWVFHVKKKSEVPQCTENVLTWCQGKGYVVKFLRCDNAGEHQTKLLDVCARFGVQIEYTAPNTPQQNGQIERMIATDRGRRNAMLRVSGFSETEKLLLRAEATQMSRRLAQLHVTASRETPPGEAIPDGNVLLRPDSLKHFGQTGFVTVRKKMLNKMEQRSTLMKMVGYAVNHASDTYRMYNPETQAVIQTRDVRWDVWRLSDSVIAEAKAAENSADAVPGFAVDDEDLPDQPNLIEPDDDVDHPPVPQQMNDGINAPDLRARGNVGEDSDRQTGRKSNIPTTRMSTRSQGIQGDHVGDPGGARVEKELAKLDFGVRFQADIVSDDEDQNEVTAMVFSAMSVESDPGEPKTISEALRSENKHHWKASMKTEVKNFMDRGAWEPCNRDEVLAKGFKPVGTKTVFKVKNEHDGSIRYKSRIVTKGYNMIPGVHFQNSFSPVATDSSVRIVIGITLYAMNQERKLWKHHQSRAFRRNAMRSTKRTSKVQRAVASLIGEGRKEQFLKRLALQVNPDPNDPWVLEVFDTVAAFLNADPGTEMYISVPEAVVALGLMTQEEADQILYRLRKTMYGNVDAALRYFLKFKSIVLSKMGLKQCKSDPCIFYRENDSDELCLMIAVHVDDSLIAGRKSEVTRFMDEFEKHLKIERLGPLTKHLGVWWEFHTDQDGEIFLKASMEKMRLEIIDDFEKATGGKPVKEFATPGYPGTTLESYKGEPVQLTEFRSILGKLLYYVTKIGPAMLNSVRELSSHMSMPGPDHWKAMRRVVGHLKSFSEYSMVYRAPEELRAICLSDSGYANCTETRRSVGGGIDTVGGMFTGASSKKQPVVSLSSAEAELIAYSDRCQAARFIQQLLGELLGEELTAIVLEDNQGCIHLVKNQKTGTRTKHLDVRWLFCRDFYIDGKILPVFVRSEENYSDGCTKNQPEKLFIEHDTVLRNGFIPYRREDVELALVTEMQNTERPVRFNEEKHLRRGAHHDSMTEEGQTLSPDTHTVEQELWFRDPDRSVLCSEHG